MEESPKPLDLKKLKDVVQHESARMHLHNLSGESESAFTLALALSAAVKKVFYEKSSTTFSSEPKLEKRPVTQFVHRMRVDAMEKFNATTVFSVIEFAANEESLEQQNYLVTLVLYLEQKFLPEFLRLLQYPYIDFDDQDEVKDGCGTLSNLIAGQYKRELAALGYKDVTMSHFESYINTAADGVGIPNAATEKYELCFDVEGTKRMVVEMVTLARLPKWGFREKTEEKKILIIEDDRTCIEIVGSFLKTKGFKVVVARDGMEGIKLLREKPDLIVLDMQMPNMNGYEFILAINEMKGIKRVPIIITTAQQGLNDIVNVEGIKEYLVKPFTPDALFKSVERHI